MHHQGYYVCAPGVSGSLLGVGNCSYDYGDDECGDGDDNDGNDNDTRSQKFRGRFNLEVMPMKHGHSSSALAINYTVQTPQSRPQFNRENIVFRGLQLDIEAVFN